MKKRIIYILLALILSGTLITLIVIGNPFSAQKSTDDCISYDVEVTDEPEEIPYIASETYEPYDYTHDYVYDSVYDPELLDTSDYPYPPPNDAETAYVDYVETDQTADFEILTATQLVSNIRIIPTSE